MRYPEFLKTGGTIGFVAPSFGCNTEPYNTAFNNALKNFHEMGYKTIEGPNCRVGNGIGISNTPEKCGEELNDFYERSDSDVLMSCGGGELMCEVVPYMDFDRVINAKPKWYMGFSDNTNFTFLSTTIADTAAIYGPCASEFGMEPWHPAIKDAFDLICGKIDRVSNYNGWEREQLKSEECPLETYNITDETIIVSDSGEPAQFSGRLVGGCVDCLVNLLGTSFDNVKSFNKKYAKDGIVWFLESCDLNVMSIRRAIWQMKNAGWFENVKGFIIGRPLCYGEEMFGIDHREAYTSLLREYNVPIVMDLDIGHYSPMMPIVSGAMADISFDGKSFEMVYKFLE